MRCLHCGNDVSILQKLSDAQFCSAEHRQNFYDDQQRLMLQRLQVSAARLQRFRRSSPSVIGASVAVNVVPTEAIAPAAVAAFCLQQQPDVSKRPFTLLMLPALDVRSAPAIPPHRITSAAAIAARLSTPVFDIPWPKYNPGLLSFPPFDPAAAIFDVIVSGLFRTASIRDWRGLSASLLVPMRGPGSPDNALYRMDPSIEPSWESLALTPELDTLRRPASLPSVELRGIQGISLSAPAIANTHTLVPLAGALSPLVVEAGVAWNTLNLDHVLQERGIAFLDRVFRMRPRSAIPGKNVPTFLEIEARAETAATAEPLRNAVPMWTASPAVEPSRTEKFFRSRPRGPVDGPIMVRETASHPEVFPARPELLHSVTAVPGVVVRSSAQVASPDATPAVFPGDQHHAIAASHSGSAPEAALPAIALKPVSCEPMPSSRMYRGRPRGPVADSNLDTLLPVLAVAAPAETSPLMPSREALPETAALEPARAERLFRMGPRSGVADRGIMGPAVNGETEPLCSRPTVPATGFSHDFAPEQVRKLFRGRPRGPVAAPVRGFETVQTGALTVSPPFPAITDRPTPAGETTLLHVMQTHTSQPAGPVCAPPETAVAGFTPTPELLASAPAMPKAMAKSHFVPTPVERFYRSRARGPVERAGLVAFERIASGTGIESVSQSAYPRYTLVALNPAPDASGRLFRMRPRAGVSSSTVALTPITLAAEQFPALRGVCPATPKPATSDLSVRATERIYRIRPRAGVSNAAETLAITAAAEPFAARPDVLYTPIADCAPVQIRRMFRPRPPAAVDGGAAARILVSPDSLNIDVELTRGGYPLGRGSSPAPAFMNRVYRVRPRAPMQDAQTMMAAMRFKHLPTADPEALFPALPCGILEDPAPALLDKLYRMRPRTGKLGAAENLPIGCDPVTVDAGSEALVRPFPLEESPGPTIKDTFRSFSKNWKTAPIDLKAMVMIIPVLLFLSLVPSGNSNPMVAHASAANSGSFRNVVATQVDRAGEGIRSRAAVAVNEDFRSGLDRWTGAPGWRGTWAEHPSGWISPGKLAILAPSIPLTDYRLEFSGQIVSRAFGFVVRAADQSNYHAIKFKLSGKAPMLRMSIVRTTVVAGKEVARKETPLPILVDADTVYHVTLDANDRYFTLMIRDRIVDFWSDAQLKSGGIGFFAGKGEKALIHNIRVKHQYDTLGRLVAATLPAER